jgi:Fe-S cluster biogenesis protein NfuA
MTIASVDSALNDVRPYLIADGGDVTVTAVENGVVFLRLEASGPSGTRAASASCQALLQRCQQAALALPAWLEAVCQAFAVVVCRRV